MSIIRQKQLWLAEPIKRLREQEQYQTPQNLQDIAVNMLFASPVLMNLLGPAAMIHAGIKPHKIFQGVSYASNSPYLKPLFEYYLPPSSAYRVGSRIGSAVGGGVMQTLGHISPLVGWAPGPERGIVKLKLPPWVKKAGVKTGAKIGGRVGSRLIPGVGWSLLAYDAYDVAFNHRLWGFDL
jgi:hypothetical protein